MQATPRVRVGGETSDPNCQRASTWAAYLQAGRHVSYAVGYASAQACAYCLKGVGEYERMFCGLLGHHALARCRVRLKGWSMLLRISQAVVQRLAPVFF